MLPQTQTTPLRERDLFSVIILHGKTPIHRQPDLACPEHRSETRCTVFRRVQVAFKWKVTLAIMAPRSRASGNDTDASMADAPEPGRRAQDEMVCRPAICLISPIKARTYTRLGPWLTLDQDVDETPDYTEDSDTNPNTRASSVVGEPVDGRKRRSEVNQLRRSIFGKKHDALGESKVRLGTKPCSCNPV